MKGDSQSTRLGYRVTLERRSNRTIYGHDIDEVALEIEFQTDSRVRFKARCVTFVILPCIKVWSGANHVMRFT